MATFTTMQYIAMCAAADYPIPEWIMAHLRDPFKEQFYQLIRVDYLKPFASETGEPFYRLTESGRAALKDAQQERN